MKVDPYLLMTNENVAVDEPTCTGNGVTEIRRHSSSSPPSPSPALKRVRYPLTAG